MCCKWSLSWIPVVQSNNLFISSTTNFNVWKILNFSGTLICLKPPWVCSSTWLISSNKHLWKTWTVLQTIMIPLQIITKPHLYVKTSRTYLRRFKILVFTFVENLDENQTRIRRWIKLSPNYFQQSWEILHDLVVSHY